MADVLARTDEQRLMRETAARVFADPQQLERNLVASGLLALPFAESDGGLNPDDSDDRTALAIAFAAKGRAFATDTLLLQAALGGGLVAATATADRDAIIAGVIEGRERIAVGLHEPGARADLSHCAMRATRMADGWTLSGTKTLVLGAESATRLIVTAKVDERRAGVPEGIGLFRIDAMAAAAEGRRYRLRDGTSASDLVLTDLALPDAALAAGPDRAGAILERALAATRLCLAAEASGIIRSIVAVAARYASERQQFGQPIGAFQVIQHRLADMALLADQSAALAAQIALRSDDRVAIDRAYRAVADMGMTAAKAAIQLHGGYGMSEDLPCGRALRRMMTIALMF